MHTRSVHAYHERRSVCLKVDPQSMSHEGSVVAGANNSARAVRYRPIGADQGVEAPVGTSAVHGIHPPQHSRLCDRHAHEGRSALAFHCGQGLCLNVGRRPPRQLGDALAYGFCSDQPVEAAHERLGTVGRLSRNEHSGSARSTD